MNRSDERKEMGAGVARSPGAARADEDRISKGRVSREKDDPERQVEEEGEDASQARSRGAAHADEAREMREEHAEEGKRGKDTVSGGRGIMRETVEADHVIGEGGKIGVKSAEGESDMASAGANRKEAGEPEREQNEKAAMGRERSVPHKNAMAHGERETVAKHTI
jgi:hypothetical protein